jgi:ABC-type multidrug transport system fused ATPase/permease subunit
MASIFKLISLFTKQERRRLIWITIAILFASLLEIVEVGSLGPFMAVVADPAIIQGQPLLALMYQIGGFQDSLTFLVFLGIAVFVLVLAATAFKMGVLYIAYRFVANRRYSLSVRLFRQYLFQPYYYFLNHNTGELSKNLLAEVDLVINGVLRPAMNTLVRGTLAVSVFVYLVIINPAIAAFAFGVFGVLYAVLYALVRPRLARHGQEVREANRLRYKTTSEAFGGIKDVKILGKEPFFAYSYTLGAKRFAATQAAEQILTVIPSQAMQSLAIGFAIAMIVLLLFLNGSLALMLPLLAVYAFAIMRIVPNVQTVFQSGTQIRYYGHTVDALYKDMTTLSLSPDISDKKAMAISPEVLPFTRHIELHQVEYSYPLSKEPVLQGIELHIIKNTTIGLVGTTGCGKTTLVDVIMGLLEPSRGVIKADETPVIFSSQDKSGGTITSWQRNFGYVPQQIFLTDDTVAANIAFGLPEDMRDTVAVERAARVANLHDFVTAELPDAYNTLVGERGIRLSGGQRQRVGIARALYHDPAILVMDEATSALDSVTEDAVMDAIHNLTHSKTIIIIAHRLSTVRECDTICLMEKGRIATRGTYDELMRSSRQFRAMAKVG